MGNERIDLTQFEGATEGPWETIEPEHPHYGVIRIKPCSATVRRYQSDFRSEETWHANAKAIAAVPELIAELKKMYEREDALVSAIKKLCDSEDSTGCSGDLTVVSLDPMLKLYELTSYSAYR